VRRGFEQSEVKYSTGTMLARDYGRYIYRYVKLKDPAEGELYGYGTHLENS
jgi:hypothetical protein